MPGKTNIRQLAGKVYRNNTEVILIFRVGDKYYPATEFNSQVFETYLHTGNEALLSQLENEMEV